MGKGASPDIEAARIGAESRHHDARTVADKAAPAHRAAMRAHARNRVQVERMSSGKIFALCK